MRSKSKVFFTLSAVCILASCILWVQGLETKNEYTSLKETVVTSVPVPENVQTKKNTVPNDTAPEMDQNLVIDFAALQKINPDIVGWLSFQDGDISLPVVQEKEPEEYMHKTFDGKERYAGCLFIQGEQSPDFTDGNTVIYGHNMLNGGMFGSLKRFVNNRNSLRDPYFNLYLANGEKYRYRIISMYVDSKNSDMCCLPNGIEATKAYIQKSLKKGSTEDAFPWTDAERKAIADGNPVVTLSTCYGMQGTPKRTLIQGILCEKGH